MKATWADISKARDILGWQPQVRLEEGIKRTVEWTRDNWDWVKNIKVYIVNRILILARLIIMRSILRLGSRC